MTKRPSSDIMSVYIICVFKDGARIAEVKNGTDVFVNPTKGYR